MSEAVGGVPVCVAEDINDDYTKLYLEAGQHTLVGDQALAFLRTRHGVGDGSDLSRISNQQVFLTSLVRKLKDEGALTNPFTMLRLGSAALENMTLSRSLTDLGVMFGMAREANDVDLDKIVFLKLPVYSSMVSTQDALGFQPSGLDCCLKKSLPMRNLFWLSQIWDRVLWWRKGMPQLSLPLSLKRLCPSGRRELTRLPRPAVSN